MSNNNNNAQPSKSAGVMMGDGPNRCNIHDFETDDIHAWNEHCKSEGHTETGVHICDCGKNEVVYNEVEYHDLTPKGKEAYNQLKCAECLTKQDNLNKMIFDKNNNNAGGVPIMKQNALRKDANGNNQSVQDNNGQQPFLTSTQPTTQNIAQAANPGTGRE